MSTNLLNYEVDPFDGDEPAYIRVQSVEYGGSYPDITASAAENYPPNASSTGPATRLFIELPYIIDLSDAGDTRPLLVKDITTNTTLTRVTAAPGANEYRVSPITSNRRSIIEVATARAGNQFGYDFYVIGGQLNAADAGKLTGATIKLAIAGQSYNENLADALIGPAADAGAAINSWIDVLEAAGGGTIMLAEGTYLVTTTIALKSKVNIMGMGPGTVVKRNANIDAVMTANNQSSIEIQNIKVDGNRATYTAGVKYGISLIGGSSQIVITKCNLVSSHINNIYGNNVSSLIIKDNIFNDCPEIDLSSGVLPITNSIISSNLFLSNLALSANIQLVANSNNNIISGNYCKGNNYQIFIIGSYNVINGNTMAGLSGVPLYMEAGVSNSVTNNAVLGTADSTDGFFIFESDSNVIVGNTINGISAGRGIGLDTSRYNTITGNNIRGCLDGISIEVGSDYNIVMGNRTTIGTGSLITDGGTGTATSGNL
jgi:parallel beta-helix repeat protein